MRAVASFFAAALSLCGLAAVPALAQEQSPLLHQQWSWEGPFGTYNLADAQRGFQVYKDVCSTCHSMNDLHYRDLAGIGLSEDQIKAIAASVTVPQGLDDQGNPKDGPGMPASMFRAPFPNAAAAKAALKVAPPDLSNIINAREGGPDYVYSILNGFISPPPGFKLAEGSNYNEYFPGHQIAMPQPLHGGDVTFAEGAPNSIPDEAHDVVTFLAWAADPDMVQRKQIGWRVVLFLVVMTGLTYAVKRKVWADVEH
ncbi:MAG TPA: cytochrome c1 [Acetobacteraceae bacterium]|nr:cytochrome c1 [Acetobacteraceae bacterium]